MRYIEALKTQKRWRYDDDICVGCHERKETKEEILSCTNLGDNDEETMSISTDWLISGSGRLMFTLGKVLAKILKVRENIMEGIT